MTFWVNPFVLQGGIDSMHNKTKIKTSGLVA